MRLLAGPVLVAFAATLCPAASAASAAATASSLRRETVIAPDGTRHTRMVVEAPPAAAAEDAPGAWSPARAFDPRGLFGGGSDTLWVDRLHQEGFPEHVAVSGDGQHVVAGWSWNGTRTSHYARTSATPTWTRSVASLSPVPVDVAEFGESVCTTGSLAPFIVLSGAGDSIIVRPHFVNFEGQYVASDDSANVMVVTATHRDTTLLSGRDAENGTLFWSFRTTKPVVGIDYSSEGNYLAITFTDEVVVRDGFTTAVLDTIPLPNHTTWPAAIAADGTLVTGGFSPVVRVWQREADSTYTERFAFDTRTTWVSAVDISDDATTVLAGSYTNSEPPSGSVVMLDANTGNPYWTLADFGDLVSAVSLSSRGLVGAAGSWGREGASEGLALAIFGRDLWYPAVYALGDDDFAALGVDTMGSVLDLELSGDGATCVAGLKRQHARELGAGGYLVAIGTPGEPPAPGAAPFAADPRAGALLAFSPNPAAPRTTLRFRAPAGGGAVRLTIHDVAGRLVRALTNGGELRGDQQVEWDGRDDDGRSLPPGLYFARLAGDGVLDTRKLVLTR